VPVVPVVLCIDVEPDDRQLDRSAPEWRGVEATASMLERFRIGCTEATGVPASFSWFWRADPQIAEVYGDPTWGLRRHQALRDATVERGDAHGVHPHSWRLDRQHRWIDDRADLAWVRHCVEMSLDAFADATGARCELTRLGDRALGWSVYRCLARRGVRVDCSVEPGEPPTDRDATAPTPDFTSAPTNPYWPRRRDVARSGHRRRGPVLLPLSAAPAGPEGSGPMRTIYPWVPESADRVSRMLDGEPAYLAFAIRTDAAIREELRPHVEAMLTAMLCHPDAALLRFVTPLEALQLLRTGRRRG
jgi:hypothetical protein